MGRKRAIFVGLDVGTQGTKALAVDSVSGDVVARNARHYELLSGLPPGAAEQEPGTWIDAVRGVMGDLLGSGRFEKSEVVGLGVSGQQHGSVLLDSNGAVLRAAKLWCDT